MALDVGVNVIEVDGRARPAIQAAATSVAAFIGRTERGVPNRPVRITTPAQFRDRFGGYLADGYLPLALDGFFINGGREAYVTRVVAPTSVPAARTLLNRAGTPAPALRVTAGYRGLPEPGAWGTRLRIDIRDDPRADTQLSAAIVGTTAPLKSLGGLRVGSVVHFMDGANSEFRKITAIDPAAGSISWVTALTGAYGVPTSRVQSAEFRLTVSYQPSSAAPISVVEEWATLSMETDSPDYAIDRVNHPFTGSRYVLLADVSGSATTGVENPAVASGLALTGSATDPSPDLADYLGSAALRTGLFAFDTVQVQLLAVPDAHLFAVATTTTPADPAKRRALVRAALDYCAARGDCTYVGSAPDRGPRPNVVPRARSDYVQLESNYVDTVEAYSALFQGNKVYGALYAPWIQVTDPAASGAPPTRFIPADGHIMGMFARTEQERGIWKAPAGNAAQLRGALDVAALFSDAQHTDLVRSGYVNGVRALPGLGIIVAASRTLSTDTRWWFVGTRLLFNFVKSSLRDGLRFVRQEPHTDELRRSVRLNVVRPFLLGLWRQGAFGSDPADATFTIKCDAENNPPNEVDLGNFKIEVYFYPVKPAETVLIVVGQQPSGASAAEA
jgi:phage tail sheath protein FI